MIFMLLSIVYHSAFEIGIIPNGAASIYNEEFWSRSHETIYVPVMEVNPDKNGIVYYSIFGIEFKQNDFSIGGNIKTYAQKSSYSKSFSPYLTRFTFNLSYKITETIGIGFNHSCTHSFEDLSNTCIFQGSYEELFIRFEK